MHKSISSGKNYMDSIFSSIVDHGRGILKSIFTATSLPDGAKVIHAERSLFQNIIIYDDNGERCMCFAAQRTGGQARISLVEPASLSSSYTKMMLGALYLNPCPQKVLIIGLGGGVLPSVISRILPETCIDAVEIDPAVVRIAEEFFNFRRTPNILVHEEDGRAFVLRALKDGGKYDLVMLDAYDNKYIPEHMLTYEFLTEVKNILSLGGVLCANTWGSSRLYHNESSTYESVFGQFFNLKENNRVILLRNGCLPGYDEIGTNAELLEPMFKEFGVSKSYLLPLFSARRDWEPDALILRDNQGGNQA